MARNHRTRHGEIDLIMYDADTLVFVEVKLRRGLAYGDPLEAVTPRKQAAIRVLAEEYVAEKEPEFQEIRFDVVGILEDRGLPRITHLEGAF